LRPRKKPEPLEEPALYDYAVAALGRRMRTITELKRLMRTRVEEGETGNAKIAAVVTRLEEHHYLDDHAYAATYTRLRQDNEKFGKRRVQQELSRKGVSSETISAALDTAYENISEEDLARKHLERKRVKQPTNEKESARVVRLLVRGGFSTGVIFKILKSWNVSDDTLAAVELIDP
jgi:regulatory protein